MTVAELREALDAAGVDHPADAKKAELERLLADANTADTSADTSADPTVAKIDAKIDALTVRRRRVAQRHGWKG